VLGYPHLLLACVGVPSSAVTQLPSPAHRGGPCTQALHAHTKYWSNPDLSLFLLRSLLQLREDAIDFTWQPGQRGKPEDETEPPPSPMGKLVTDLHAFQYEFP
jgi:hypothetical protein